MQKFRVDQLLVQRGLVESPSLAKRLVMAGSVRVNGEMVFKPSVKVMTDCEITIDQPNEFVSRGGLKLKEALHNFAIDIDGLVCADVGASTGGFTDCLLQNGASKVYAIDVGYGVLHWQLRKDPRVIVMERTNARFLTSLPELVQLVTIDASFISLNYLLPVVLNWFESKQAQVIALIKPQFEAERGQAQVGAGVIRDHGVHLEVLERVIADAQNLGLSLYGLVLSPIKGPKGNVEFLAFFRNKMSKNPPDSQLLIERVMAELTLE